METDVVGDCSIHPEIVTETLSEYDLVISRKRSKKMKNVRSELDHYLEDDVLSRTLGFDVLNWWKANGPKYPTLQVIAKDILAISLSTAAFESAFSTSGRLVSPHRSRLHSNTLKALMCAQSWLLGAEMKGTHIIISSNLHIIISLLYDHGIISILNLYFLLFRKFNIGIGGLCDYI